MRKTILSLVVAAIATAGYLAAGGFWLELGNPEASAEARKANAVVTVRAVGCHDPAAAQVTAVAIGTVNGRRRTMPLELTKLSAPGMYAIARQWPEEGKWVIRLEGRNAGMFTNALVAAGPDGVDRLHARYELKAFGAGDVEGMLR